MKNPIRVLGGIAILVGMHVPLIFSQTVSENHRYDENLAKSLGADDYGMKSYTWVILKSGTTTSTDREIINNVFRGHLENINRLVDEGKLIVAGPLGKNDHSYRGIFIFSVNDPEEVKQILQTDPAIKAGFLDTEIFTWYGSAALPTYLEASDKIWKKKP